MESVETRSPGRYPPVGTWILPMLVVLTAVAAVASAQAGTEKPLLALLVPLLVAAVHVRQHHRLRHRRQ